MVGDIFYLLSFAIFVFTDVQCNIQGGGAKSHPTPLDRPHTSHIIHFVEKTRHMAAVGK